MKQILRSTLVLTLITLIAGLCLAGVYEITKQPIAEAEQAAALAAYEAVLPGATVSREAPAGMESTTPTDMDGVTVEDIVFGYDGTDCRGLALRVTSPNGYGGNITLAVGVDMDGRLTGVSVISQSETAGLGANCDKPSFTDQFVGISGRVVWTKAGKQADNEIDAISGATVTTRAVTEAVNGGLAYAQKLLQGGDAQ